MGPRIPLVPPVPVPAGNVETMPPSSAPGVHAARRATAGGSPTRNGGPVGRYRALGHSGVGSTTPGADSVAGVLPARVTLIVDGRLLRVVGVTVRDTNGANHTVWTRPGPLAATRVMVRTRSRSPAGTRCCGGFSQGTGTHGPAPSLSSPGGPADEVDGGTGRMRGRDRALVRSSGHRHVRAYPHADRESLPRCAVVARRDGPPRRESPRGAGGTTLGDRLRRIGIPAQQRRSDVALAILWLLVLRRLGRLERPAAECDPVATRPMPIGRYTTRVRRERRRLALFGSSASTRGAPSERATAEPDPRLPRGACPSGALRNL